MRVGMENKNNNKRQKKAKVIELPPLFDNQLLTYDQAAMILGVTPQYLRVLKANGQIPSVDIGPKCVRFRVASLNRWIAEREVS